MQCHIKKTDHPFVMGPSLLLIPVSGCFFYGGDDQVKVTFTEECAAQSSKVKL